ncbi:MAG: stage III sporulation protein AF [Anaerovoracaceae bacterium]|jgi:stage III sporulation protein AF
MMEQVYVWVRDIFLVIISLSFFQILIPNSQMEKYLKFIFSMIVLAIIVEPVIFLLNGE